MHPIQVSQNNIYKLQVNNVCMHAWKSVCTILLVCFWLQEIFDRIYLNCIEDRWKCWTFCFEDRNFIFFGHHQGRLAIHSGCVQVLWNKRSIKVLPVYCNVEWSGLVGVELFNFSEVHVDIIFGSCILCLPSDDQGRAVISWCGSSTHDNRWWLVIITTLGVDTKGGIYVVIVVIGSPNAIINIVSIPR